MFGSCPVACGSSVGSGMPSVELGGLVSSGAQRESVATVPASARDSSAGNSPRLRGAMIRHPKVQGVYPGPALNCADGSPGTVTTLLQIAGKGQGTGEGEGVPVSPPPSPVPLPSLYRSGTSATNKS